jgi:glycosyltransferase involved in cell wall biosynthesis
VRRPPLPPTEWAHVAVLNPTAEMGGAEISLLEMTRRLDGSPRVTLILPQEGPLSEAARGLGLGVQFLEWPADVLRIGERAQAPRLGATLAAGARVPRLVRRLVGLLAEVDADGLVTNGIKAHLLGSMARKRARIPVIWYLRDGLEGRRFSPWLLKAVAHRCDGAVAVSKYVATEWSRVLPRRTPISLIFDLLDLERFRPGLAPPSDLRKNPGEVWYGVIGALTPLKGQDLFLEAAAKVARRVPETRFLIVGGNWYAAESGLSFAQSLRSQAESLDLAGRVAFLGQRDDVPEILSLLDVLVQPNRGPEGLGRSVLEAMASGVPVIAVDRWGPAEIVADGQTGLLAPWLDVPALAECMERLGRDPDLRKRLGAAGRDWILGNLDPQMVVGRFRTALRGFAGQSAQGH